MTESNSALMWTGSVVSLYWILYIKWCANIVSVLWREEGYTMKYSLSPREIPRSKPEGHSEIKARGKFWSWSSREVPSSKPDGFLEGSCYISLYFPTRVKIQTSQLLLQLWPDWEMYIGRVDYQYCSDGWAIRENIAQLIDQYWRFKFQYENVEYLRMICIKKLLPTVPPTQHQQFNWTFILNCWYKQNFLQAT